jgi:hypothetical protein
MKTKLIAVAALFAIAARPALAADSKDVIVTNGAANPVPTTQIGTSSVNVANTPTVNVASMPSVTLAGAPSVTLAGTPSVTIANTPTVTMAAPHGFEAGAHVTVPAGSVGASGTFTVPANKRAVIEFASIFGNMGGNSEVTVGVQSATILGTFNAFALPVTANAFGASGAQAVKLYAEPGTTVFCVVDVVPDGLQKDAQCAFSGYLIDP